MDFEHAKQAFTLIRKELKPYCSYIRASGALRRREGVLWKIDIVCCPDWETDALGESVISSAFFSLINQWRDKPSMKEELTIKCTPDFIGGAKVELHIAKPHSCGFVMARETGDEGFFNQVIDRKLKEMGLSGGNHELRDAEGNIVDVPDEKAFFALLGYKEPPRISKRLSPAVGSW